MSARYRHRGKVTSIAHAENPCICAQINASCFSRACVSVSPLRVSLECGDPAIAGPLLKARTCPRTAKCASERCVSLPQPFCEFTRPVCDNHVCAGALKGRHDLKNGGALIEDSFLSCSFDHGVLTADVVDGGRFSEAFTDAP